MHRTYVVFRAFVIALALGALSATSASARVRASLEVDVGLFYENLAPYGDWVEVSDYGWVWTPHASGGWRPYSVGHWVWTNDDGWLWVSDEDYGWAVYHYGRWYPDPAYGWVWVPGYEWGPAWVSWRSGGGYIGWAPLPPSIGWQVGIGFGVGFAEFDTLISPRQYCFVPEHAFLSTAISRQLVPVVRNTTVINQTQNVTNYTVSGNRVVNQGVPIAHVEKVAGRPVPRMQTVAVNSVGAAHGGRVRGNEAPVFRPVVRRADNKVPPHGKSLSRNEPMGRAAAARTDGKVKGLARSSDEPQRKAEGQRAQQQDRQRQARQLERRQAQQLEKQHQAQQREADKQLARERQDRERQRQQLEKRQAWERQDLERTHQKEIKSPTRGVSWAELQRQHEQEHRALAEQHHQQQQQLDARRAGQPPRASRIQPAPPRTAENRPRASNPTKPSPPKPNAKEKPLNNR